MTDNISYEFGEFLLDISGKSLFKNGEEIQIPKKLYDLLLLLVERAGEIVTKEEIVAGIWNDHEVDDNSITQIIHRLRVLLDDNSKSPKFIVTIPGSGYLFNLVVSSRSREAHFARSLPAVAPVHPGPPVPNGKATMWPHRITVIAISIILIAFIVAIAISRIGIDSINRPDVGKLVRLTSFPGIESYPAFSPDGKAIAFTTEGEGGANRDVYVSILGGGEPVWLTSEAGIDVQPVWSPDGLYVAFLRTGQKFDEKAHLIVIPAFGGQEMEIARVWSGLDWSPDGKSFAVCDQEGSGGANAVSLLSRNGESRFALTHPDPKRSEFDTFPKFSPDGRYIAFIRTLSGVSGDIFICDIKNKNIRQLTFDKKQIGFLAWHPDGNEILFVSDRSGNQLLWRIPFEGGSPKPVKGLQSEIEHFAISKADNSIAFTEQLSDALIELRKIDPNGGTSGGSPLCQINSSRIDNSPRISPDGSRVVFVTNRDQSQELWIAGSDCRNEKRLTSFRESGIGSPRWAPDGSRIAFDRVVNGQSEIFIISVEDSTVQQVTNHQSPDIMPAWSGDGQWIYFCSQRSGRYEIWKVPASGGEASQLTHSGGREAIEAPDGRSLYFTKNGRLWNYDLNLGVEAPVAGLQDFTFGRFWDVSGGGIYFVAQGAGKIQLIERFDLMTGQVINIGPVNGILPTWEPGISISRDEKLLAISYFSYRFGDILLIDKWR